jgi:hypothetical protein
LLKEEIRNFEQRLISRAYYEERELGIIGRHNIAVLELRVGTGEVVNAYYTGQRNRYPHVSALLLVNKESKYAVTAKDLWQFRPSYMSLETRLVNLTQDHFHFNANQMWGLTTGSQPWDGETWPEERMNISRKDIHAMGRLFFTMFRHVGPIHDFLMACKLSIPLGLFELL